MNFENSSAFIYVIYDTDIFEIHSVHLTEKDCVKCYNEYYNGFVNIDWKAVNIIDFLKK